MKQNRITPVLFKSATLRLTGWYLLILMLLSLIFSVVIYNVATNEIGARLERFQTGLQSVQPQDILSSPNRISNALDLRNKEEITAATNLSIELLYVNAIVFVIGGFVSYFLARHTFLPIEKAHLAQSRFTSDASHELRTPLAVMRAEIEVILRDKNATNEELKETLSSNLEEVNKLSRLSEMLLNLSRLDSTKLKIEPINLNKVVINTIKDFKQPAKRISLHLNKQQTITGNETAISELIKILVDNALQYSPKDSVIAINLSKTDCYAKFEITNLGAGIDPEKLPHIFDRFYRADASRTGGEHKGYGLGLALAKNIVELHNGKLFASSVPGDETTFSFLLPLN